MSQGSTVIPTTGTQSGLAIAQDMNAALNAVLTQSSGSSAPTNGSLGTPDKGQSWLDTSVTPNALRMWDGANWIVQGYIDATNHVWDPPIGGGVATINSATTTDIWANPASNITVSGTATITQFASADAVPGTRKLVTASGAFTMTHDATKLILPTGQPVTVAPGDSFEVVALSSTNVRVINYTKADGTSLQVSNRYLGELIDFTGSTAPALTVFPVGQTLSRASYPALWAFAQIEITAGSTLYTVGNGSTTFGIPDKRGRVSAVNDALGGTPAGRLTGALGTGLGAQTRTIGTGNLPPYTPTGTVLSSTTTPIQGQSVGGSNTGTALQGNNTTGQQNINSITTSNFTGSAQGGANTPLATVQPTLVTNCLLYAGA